ncbi:MAG: hypothetical protein PHV29_04040, partial [Candidatus Pacebacteria bacterium]|nr:hypothetical protein [Candidatus Paceibacterota bacterium]
SLFETTLTNLNPGTTYYYNFKACNQAGCSSAEELSFKTLDAISEPVLKISSFIEEEQSRRISFEMLSTGHDDITVNRATLNIFRTRQSSPIATKTMEGGLIKDTVYSFEIENGILSKGSAYEYSITLENASLSKTFHGKTFITRPGDVSNVNISELGSNVIRISFTKGQGSQGTIILNKDREVIYQGSNQSFDYQLTSEDANIYLIGTLAIYGVELRSFNEVTIDVSSYFKKPQDPTKAYFNNGVEDHPLRVGNKTKDAGTQRWSTNVTNATVGDELRVSVYYHNGGNIDANNTKLELSFNKSSLLSSLNSKISSNGFNDYQSQVNIALGANEFIKFKGTGKWYSNYDGHNHLIRDIFYTVENNKIVFDLGSIYPGYAPNDGYVIFDAVVTSTP